MHEHNMLLSARYPGYEYCVDCGSFHSVAQKPPAEIYENNYWDGRERSSFDDQRYNLTEEESCGISKVNKVLQHIPEQHNALEIGCAPGELLKALSLKGFTVYGIEPDETYIEPILNVWPLAKIIKGYFPDVFKGINDLKFDYIIALDVVEHALDYEAFFAEAFRLLNPGGTFLFMSPVITEEHGNVREKDYKPDEHIWIFTEKYLRSYLEELFASVVFDYWQIGHNLIVCKKPI